MTKDQNFKVIVKTTTPMMLINTASHYAIKNETVQSLRPSLVSKTYLINQRVQKGELVELAVNIPEIAESHVLEDLLNKHSKHSKPSENLNEAEKLKAVEEEEFKAIQEFCAMYNLDTKGKALDKKAKV